MAPQAGRGATSVLLLLSTLFVAGWSLEISELRGPQMIQNGSEASVVLDCDYKLSDSESADGLVVKWFFNNEPSPVYQWIPSKKPQDLGVLKGKLDLTWTVSDHEAKKHRALHIIRPTTELSGEYTCTVSTFNEERSMRKSLVVFVPEKSITLTESKSVDEKSVLIECEARGVFPEPTLKLFQGSETDTTEIEDVNVKTMLSGEGVFDISAKKLIADRDLQNTPTIIECELGIKDTDYKRKKRVIYYPDGYTGPRITSAEVKEVSEEIPGNTASRSVVLDVWCLFALAATILHLH
ncbi:selection and upkeep of intraepithelial T-cells protein 2-like isoform X2 [Cloeon dipterum]|uniref:selection and upkeep of intraepithelial T-cells protein 2-like isoform X2 n=1 Tax=Cloeon dipterum TaxID=197152 RepID=UPI00321FC31B